MSKKSTILICVLLVLVLLTGCTREIKNLEELDEDEFYIYEGDEVAFEIEEYSDDMNRFLYPTESTRVVYFSEAGKGLQTKRGIGIGSDVLDVIDAYQGIYCYTGINDRENGTPQQYTKYHEAGMFYDKMERTRNILHKYSERDYLIEYDYYMLGDDILSFDELEGFLDEKGINYYELIHGINKYNFGITRRYIRFYFENDRVKDIWVYFTHD